MKQSGTYHIYKIENNIRVVNPIANAYLYFIQNDAIKLTAKTDAKGKFSFDLPLGSYIVGSASEGGIEQILANGSKFTLDASSKLDAFEKWINAPAADVDSELLKRFRELAKQSQDAADEAQKILNQMNSGSIGLGLWVRENAVKTTSLKLAGLYSTNDIDTIEPGIHGVSLAKNFTELNFAKYGMTGGSAFLAYEAQNAFRNSDLKVTFKSLNNDDTFEATKRNGVWQGPFRILSDYRTTVDSNGFIKAASPIVKLFDNKIESNDQFYEEPIFEKIGTGTYKISNTKGLSKDGWTYEKPRGGDGTPYFRIQVTKLEDGCIISVHDEYDSLEEATITDINGNTRTINKVVKVLGEARDIKPNERWIDLRFEEDHESIAQEEEEVRIQMEKEELERAETEAKRLAEEEVETARKLEEERNLERELME